MNVGFFVRQFTERGTEISAYDYAHYNETILGNKSFIICFTEEAQQRNCHVGDRVSFPKFESRFPILQINDIPEMKEIISKCSLDFFYTQTYGAEDLYQFENSMLWGSCKTIKHCVFNTTCPESNFYISISNCLNVRFGTNVPVIPCIVQLPECNENLRSLLGIPADATVIGRHGAKDTFDIPMAHDAIQEFLLNNSNTYFLFMNTDRFHYHPKIIYLDPTLDSIEKTKFINTCDAMIHARSIGETFGLAIAEFSLKNKPVITCRVGDTEHVNILGDKSVIYNSKDELVNIFKNIRDIIKTKDDWNAYKDFRPENVMKMFKDMIFTQGA